MTLACRGTQVCADGRTVLATVSATLPPGRVTAILGPNGAGKSTLLALLSGQSAAGGGTVRLDGVALQRHRAVDLARRRAVMLQDSAVAFDFSAQEVVELGRFPHRARPAADEAAIVPAALALTGVAHLAQRAVPTLSGGEKARVQLARALAQVWHPPPDDTARWLLLDEPTAALDLAHQHHTMRLLRERAHGHGMGVVVVLHDLNLALRYADAVLLLGAGEEGDLAAVHGPVDTVLTPERVRAVWGMDCEPVTGADGVRQLVFGAADIA